MPAVSCKTGWSGTTPAAIHPGWPRRRRVYLRVGVRSSPAQQHHARSVQMEPRGVVGFRRILDA
jgi:hypothetical protein